MSIDENIRQTIVNGTKINSVSVDWESSGLEPPNGAVTRNLLDVINNIPDDVAASANFTVVADPSGKFLLSVTVGE